MHLARSLLGLLSARSVATRVAHFEYPQPKSGMRGREKVWLQAEETSRYPGPPIRLKGLVGKTLDAPALPSLFLVSTGGSCAFAGLCRMGVSGCVMKGWRSSAFALGFEISNPFL